MQSCWNFLGEANHLVLQRSSGIIPGSQVSVKKKKIVEILHTVGAKEHWTLPNKYGICLQAHCKHDQIDYQDYPLLYLSLPSLFVSFQAISFPAKLFCPCWQFHASWIQHLHLKWPSAVGLSHSVEKSMASLATATWKWFLIVWNVWSWFSSFLSWCHGIHLIHAKSTEGQAGVWILATSPPAKVAASALRCHQTWLGNLQPKWRF